MGERAASRTNKVLNKRHGRSCTGCWPGGGPSLEFLLLGFGVLYFSTFCWFWVPL